jgi:hypothetical protein
MKKINKKTYIFLKFLFTFILLFIAVMFLIVNVLKTENVTYGDVDINVGKYPKLKVSNEESALSNDSTIVSLDNNSESSVNYKLYFTVDKTSTIDTKYIRLNFNNNTYDLSKLNYLEINNKYYYFIQEGTIDAKTSEPFDSYIWIDSSFTGDINESKIFIDYDTLA